MSRLKADIESPTRFASASTLNGVSGPRNLGSVALTSPREYAILLSVKGADVARFSPGRIDALSRADFAGSLPGVISAFFRIDFRKPLCDNTHHWPGRLSDACAPGRRLDGVGEFLSCSLREDGYPTPVELVGE